jgi:hypothetical protein
MEDVMVKKLLFIFFVLILVLFFAQISFASDKTVNIKTKVENSKKTLKNDITVKKNLIEKKAQLKTLNKPTNTSIWFDDFEGGEPSWIPAALWTNVPTEFGLEMGDHSGWHPIPTVTTTPPSPMHAWHIDDEEDTGLDLLISPVIYIPEECEGSPITGATLSYWEDIHLPDWVDDVGNLTDYYQVYAGRADVLWKLDSVDPVSPPNHFIVTIGGEFTGDGNVQALQTPEIDLSNAVAPVGMELQHHYISEAEWDYCAIDVSTDNFLTYRTIAFFTGTVPTYVGDLVNVGDEFVGQVIKIRFRYHSDFNTTEENAHWSIDDIVVTDANGTLYEENGDGPDGSVGMERWGLITGSGHLGLDFDHDPENPDEVWELRSPLSINRGLMDLFASGAGIGPGDSVRLAFRLKTNGDITAGEGRGLSIDDVDIHCVGKPDRDLVALAFDDPCFIQVGDNVPFGIWVGNGGTESQGNFQWKGRVEDAEGNPVGIPIIGSFSGTIEPDSIVFVPSINNWIAERPGRYSFVAYTIMSGDKIAENDTTRWMSNDPDGGYSRFFVNHENLLFTSQLSDAPWDETPLALMERGFVVRSNSEPGVVTWQTGSELWTFPFGALVYYDSLGRSQDEELIIPRLDFSYITSAATLTFKAKGVAGFSYTRFSVSVSYDCCNTWCDVFQRVRGFDPQTGIDYGGPAHMRNGMDPAVINLTPFVAGRHNVCLRFRYQAEDDGDWVIWKVAVSGMGLKAANLVHVMDIPRDQGKQVRLTWFPSPNDGMLDGVPITQYGVWRGFGAGLPPNSQGVVKVENIRSMISNIKVVASGTQYYDATNDMLWDFVGSVIAHRDSVYNFVASTLRDDAPFPFMVSAHTANPEIFANSNVNDGVSTDDLPPNPPANLSAAAENGAILLTWNEPTNEEPALYSIYRSEISGNYGDAVATTTSLEFRDETVDRSQTVYYRITASDYAGNKSGPSNEEIVLATSVAGEEIALPTEYKLCQNFPNPFNPKTSIKYQLPEANFVKLVILNSLGQKVRTLINGSIAAGYHNIDWDGRDSFGNPVSNGIYLYHFEAGRFVETRKMVFMK